MFHSKKDKFFYSFKLQMPIIPIHYSKELIALIESMLNSDPKRRPTVNKILRDAFIKKNIMLFLERTKQKYYNLGFSILEYCF
jgi:serine/threonine protein kinase